MHIALSCDAPERAEALVKITQDWGLIHDTDAIFSLILTEWFLELRKRDEPKLGAVHVDLSGGYVGYRRKFGGGKKQPIAKAVGLNKGIRPTVLDATAGLGRDAFVLASLGCTVMMVERHPVIGALLEDGLKRAKLDANISGWVSERMLMKHASSYDVFMQLMNDTLLKRPDVIYLDPMYPHKKKSALAKKEMRMLRSLVGTDMDAYDLFALAYALATKRIVVKRPNYAKFLSEKIPSVQIKTKNNRFDVYVKAPMR
ncbi:class I SAM-dependent methyltransferase [Candidatus Enterovibrio altilux]|uniref:class I SAM-dependent methyltransferase n=1 Tax=Candidatus Enterovibrio altilux TaxID=1927128 RepID=UPI000BBBE23A|nr:class I SAM-dependent methyltransferase [Candidatus Enterovibrio luxaltus]